MNEIGFRKYLADLNVSKKIISDHVSRLKRIEKAVLNCDLDDEYEKDGCSQLLKLCKKNYDLAKLDLKIVGNLPIGNYSMNTFRYSINKYCDFKKTISKSWLFLVLSFLLAMGT